MGPLVCFALCFVSLPFSSLRSLHSTVLSETNENALKATLILVLDLSLVLALNGVLSALSLPIKRSANTLFCPRLTCSVRHGSLPTETYPKRGRRRLFPRVLTRLLQSSPVILQSSPITRNVLTFVNTTAIAYRQNSAFLRCSWHHAIAVVFTNVRTLRVPVGPVNHLQVPPVTRRAARHPELPGKLRHLRHLRSPPVRCEQSSGRTPRGPSRPERRVKTLIIIKASLGEKKLYVEKWQF